ncbi:origin recognition complex subunit 5-like isoform X2 [Eurytemora carolleeae]|uniref:origin recognition complex subunit 5-like isoform X2 n=1 Tax=Eurytemora carolleeae TaxID=1294199 RepID=UPI000C7848DC|nr:origin recognition complex subunit 5-like isoform X2 [Eurytemora carolleeae]|eukprot:XP_023328261.1 origin recognition complex subunit 5-like isoform X2 [Eurytemora affinis]
MGDVTRPLSRDEQIEKLRLVLAGGPGISVPETIFLHGLGATGKTRVIKWVLETEQIQHAVFHCVEMYNVRLMLESLVVQLTGEESRKCENISEFISFLGQELNPKQVYVILFEESERFRDADSHLKHVFCRLQELTGLNICCIFESRIDWTRFLPNRGLPYPYIIHFPQYKKGEMTELLISQLPGEKSWEFKRDFISLVQSIFFMVARSFTELSHIAGLHYSEYCRPVDSGECKETDTKKLWFNIDKDLKKCLSVVHLREVSSQQLRELQKQKEEQEEQDTGVGGVIALNPTRLSVELPFYSKFLLISAYLASYNPAKTDKRFFVKHHGKQRKTSQSIKAKEKFNSQLTGPKQFPLERMLAIFYNVIEERVNPTANIYTQISSLVRLQLITAVGTDQMDQPKYKCNVTLEFIRTISKSLQFEIQKYLYSQ